MPSARRSTAGSGRNDWFLSLADAAERLEICPGYRSVCGCPLFRKHDLWSFGGAFDRTCVRPLIVAFDDAAGRYAVRKAGFASVHHQTLRHSRRLRGPACR
jgi:hypothetical protein